MSADKIILIIMAIFAVIGGIDRIFGSRLGLGKEFEKGIVLMGQLFLSRSRYSKAALTRNYSRI